MDVGLVCDVCSTFSPMGEKLCSSCGGGLSLDAQAQKVAEPPQPAENACVSCGHEIAAGHRFCGHCGADQRYAQKAPQPKAAPAISPSGGKSKTMFFSAIQATRAKLVLIKGDGMDGVSFTLAGEPGYDHIAGRENAPLLFDEDPFLSPTHANFFYRDSHLIVRDEDSVNGVYIRIRGTNPIRMEDRFLVGEQVLEVQPTGTDEALTAESDGTFFFASRRQANFKLVQVLRGGDTGLASLADDDTLSIGREGNDLNFEDDPFISGHHAQVSFAEGRLSLTDLGSKNGTFLRVNGEADLEHGDYVFMGQQLLRVEIV